MSINVTAKHLQLAESLVEEAKRNGGLAPVDLAKFWADQELAHANPWGPDIPQAPLGMLMSHECLFAELGIEEDWYKYTHDPVWRAQTAKAYNTKADRIVGRRILSEHVPDRTKQYPGTKGLHDLFEAKNIWNVNSYWLMESAHGEDELQALLDRVEQRLDGDLRSFLLPDNWESEKARLLAEGVKPPLYRGQRGPVTFAASVYGPEPLIYLVLDNPGLAARFRDLILRAILAIARIKDEEAGYTPDTAPHGWYWADDNCCLMNPDMYEHFGYPILKAVFDRYSPNPEDLRGQHSDSPMGHLLPLLGQLGMTNLNLGPTVMIDEIRRHCPRAVIRGQLAPFTLSRNEEVNIVAEFLRDFDMGREHKGWVFDTAGSINNGSMLTGMRLIMAAIQRYGRFGA